MVFLLFYSIHLHNLKNGCDFKKSCFAHESKLIEFLNDVRLLSYKNFKNLMIFKPSSISNYFIHNDLISQRTVSDFKGSHFVCKSGLIIFFDGVSFTLRQFRKINCFYAILNFHSILFVTASKPYVACENYLIELSDAISSCYENFEKLVAFRPFLIFPPVYSL